MRKIKVAKKDAKQEQEELRRKLEQILSAQKNGEDVHRAAGPNVLLQISDRFH